MKLPRVLASLMGILLAACSGGDRPAPESGQTGEVIFTDVAEKAGLHFDHFIGATGDRYIIEVMGAGCALFDYDNDGDLDALLLQGKLLTPGKTMADSTFPLRDGQTLGNKFFRNELVETGELHFTDVTEEAGLAHVGYGMGAATGDYDNDGDIDLYLANFGPNLLYRNNGDGTFTDITAAAGVGDERWGSSTAFLDYNHDGRLDLMVTNYVDFTFEGNKDCYTPTGENDYCTPLVYNGAVDKLWRNDGDGRFTDVTVESGIASAFGPGLGITTSDVNSDGLLDIYVANDTTANLLWINQGDGTFEETGLEAGVAYSEDGMPKAGMGTSFGDFDGDGDDDLIVLNLRAEGCSLYINEGDGYFTDVTLRFGLGHTTYQSTGFGVDWFDYDHDGWLDLFMANGAVTVIEELRVKGHPYPFQQPNLLLRNLGGGTKIDEVSAAGALRLEEVSRGAAFGDIDNDGDIDILVSNNNGRPRLLINEVGNRSNWMMLELEGTKTNRQGLGARVGLIREGKPDLWRRAHTDSSYCSASEPAVHFGLGDETGAQTIVVKWTDGSSEQWDGLEINNKLKIRQGTGKPL